MSPKLISTIIAIIIGILATLAGIRYGGEAFNEGRAKAEALTVLNAAEQVKGAADLHYNLKGNYAVGYDELAGVDDTGAVVDADIQGVYLTERVRLPDEADISLDKATVTITGINDAACEVLDEDGYACLDEDTGEATGEITF